MRIAKLVSACAASAMALALFEATAAEAASNRTFAARSVSRTLVAKRQVTKQTTIVKKKVITKKVVTKQVLTKKVIKTPKLVTKVPSKLISKGLHKFVVKNSGLKLGTVKIKNLPIHKAVAGNALFKARLGVPQGMKPKITLTIAPKKQYQLRMSPFIQKHWKKSFFWIAIAGIGYITVPEFYYDRFVTYVNLDDPDYDECIKLLSYAALEEEEFYMVREPMPPTAVYRYSAKTAPTPAPKDVALNPQEGGTACALTPFVERKWNRAFVWVQVPEMGSVTVPEDYYDRFYGHVSGEPPNFIGACQVLVEAAAADMMASTSIDVKRTDYN